MNSAPAGKEKPGRKGGSRASCLVRLCVYSPPWSDGAVELTSRQRFCSAPIRDAVELRPQVGQLFGHRVSLLV
jgi:hypothetical protein